jgi:hypothetical protein
MSLPVPSHNIAGDNLHLGVGAGSVGINVHDRYRALTVCSPRISYCLSALSLLLFVSGTFLQTIGLSWCGIATVRIQCYGYGFHLISGS